MPLDPNIFFQGAALRQANDARTQQLIGGLFDKLEARRMAEQDPERMLRASVARVVQGQGTPEDEKLIKFESILKGGETKYMPDEFGNVRAVSQPTLYDRLYGAGTQPMAVYGQDGGGIPPVDMASLEGPTSIMDKIPLPPMGGQYTGDNFEGGEPGIDLQRIADAKVRNAAAVNKPAIPLSKTNAYVATTKVGQLEGFKTDEAIREAQAKADIGASSKQAETVAAKRGEAQVSNEQKIQAVNNMISNLENFGIETVKQLPSGMLENIATKAINLSGNSNAATKAQARLDSTLPLLMANAKELTRSAGEGTFTDADQRIISNMFFNDNDSLDTKIEKYNTLLDIFKRTHDRLSGNVSQATQGTAGKPGFKFLGVE